jgi:hypothetical protein
MVRARHLVPGELLVLETRATRWAFLPGPIVAILVTAFLSYSAAAAVWAPLPGMPSITPALAGLPGGTLLHEAVFGFFAFVLIVSGLWFVARYIRWWSTVYAVTDHRVLVQRGFLSRAVDEIPVDQIRGVDASQSLWSRIFRYGTVRVSSEGGRGIGNEDWPGVPRPFEFQRTIETQMQAHSLPHLLRAAPPEARPPPPPGASPARSF